MNTTISVSVPSTRATERLGERVGAAAQAGDFIGLIGDLGAGKTSFARGFAVGAGLPENVVSSPTFALVNAYDGGRLPVLHADLYRLSDAEELYDMGFHELIGGDAALLVEWLDRVPEVAPDDWLEIRIEKRATSRRFHFTAHGPRAARLLEHADVKGA